MIQGNTIFDNNGNGIDIDSGANFIIDNNYSYNPGNREFPDALSYTRCSYGNGSAIALCDIRNSTITNNTA